MKKHPKFANKLLLYYEEHHNGGEICKGQEGMPWPDREDEIIEVEFLALLRHDSKDFSHSVETIYADFDITKAQGAYLVVVRFSDGDTFGRTLGYHSVDGVYETKEKAQVSVKEIEDTRYKEWKSFFGRFESVEIVYMKIGD